MLTHEIATKAQVTLDTVRFYTRKGLLEFHKDPDNGYKQYDAQALQRLQFITQARRLGFSLKEIESIIATSQQGQSPCPDVRALMAQKIEQTQSKIEALQRDLQVMQQAFDTWQSQADGTPDDQSVCCLIETWNQQQTGSQHKEKA